jgi:acetyltransferase
MSTYRLSHLFRPRSVAVVGGSPRRGSVGHAVLANLRGAGFAGPIGLVNQRHRTIDGVKAVARLEDLRETPDLIVVTTPPVTVPAIIETAGAAGVPAAIVITAGLGRGAGSPAEAMRASARKYGLRIIGPNCLGVIVPPARLNASFAANIPPAGDLALISQSGGGCSSTAPCLHPCQACDRTGFPVAGVPPRTDRCSRLETRKPTTARALIREKT